MIQEAAPFPDRQLVVKDAHEVVANIVARASFLEAAIVVRDPSGRAVVVAFVQSLGVSVKAQQRQAGGKPSLHAHRSGVIGAMPEIGIELDGAELRIRFIVLRRLKYLVQHRRIGRNIQRNGVDVPVVLQAHAGGSLVDHLHQPVVRELVLKTARPAHHVGHANVRVVPLRRARAEVAPNIGDAAVRLHRVTDRGRSLR